MENLNTRKAQYTVKIEVSCKRPEDQGQRIGTFESFPEAIEFQLKIFEEKGIETYIVRV